MSLAAGWFGPLSVLVTLLGGGFSVPLTIFGVTLCWVFGVRALRSGIVVHGETVLVRGILWSYRLLRRDVALVSVADAVTLRFADCIRIRLTSGRSIKCVSVDPKWVDDYSVLAAVKRAIIPRE